MTIARERRSMEAIEASFFDVHQYAATLRGRETPMSPPIPPSAAETCQHHQTFDYRLGECERVARSADVRLDEMDRWKAAWEEKWRPLSFMLAAAGGGVVTAGIAFVLSKLS